MKFQYLEKINLRNKVMVIPLAYTNLTITARPVSPATFEITIQERLNDIIISSGQVEVRPEGSVIYQGTPNGNHFLIFTDFVNDIYVNIIGEI